MKRFLISTTALIMGALCASAYGQTDTDSITVTADVQQACSITTTANVAFGTYDPLGANSGTGSDLDATGSVGVTCTRGSTGITIELSDGGNHNGTTRRLANGGATEFLDYELYQPAATTPGAACAYATVWGEVADTAELTPTGTTWGTTQQSFNVCGRIARGQDAAAANFTDLVTATVNF